MLGLLAQANKCNHYSHVENSVPMGVEEEYNRDVYLGDIACCAACQDLL